jgi:hypothetical protein
MFIFQFPATSGFRFIFSLLNWVVIFPAVNKDITDPKKYAWNNDIQM